MRSAVNAVENGSADAAIQVHDHAKLLVRILAELRLIRNFCEASVSALDIEAVLLGFQIVGVRAVLGAQPHDVAGKASGIIQRIAEVEAACRLVVEIAE